MTHKSEIIEYLSAMNRAYPDLSGEDFCRVVKRMIPRRLTNENGIPTLIFYNFLSRFCDDLAKKKLWSTPLKIGDIVRPCRTRCVKWRVGEIRELRISQKKALVKITHEADIFFRGKEKLFFPCLRVISLAQLIKK